jgi:uncharacterized protein
MADITPPIPADRQLIQSYGDGGFRITGVEFKGSVIVTPLVTALWSAIDSENLAPDDILAALRGTERGTVLLLGAGTRFAAVSASFRQGLREAGIGLEVMDTGAACRTYNVLLAEDRAVAAALIAV